MRAFGWGLDSLPRIARGEGSYLYDTTDRWYLAGSGGPAANVEPDGQGTAQDVVAFTSSGGKFRTGMHEAGPEHEEYKSGYESNEFISCPACEVD